MGGAYGFSEVSQLAEPVPMLQTQHLQGVGHYEPLDLVVGGGDALEHLQPLQGQAAALILVGDHAVRQMTSLSTPDPVLCAATWLWYIRVREAGQHAG